MSNPFGGTVAFGQQSFGATTGTTFGTQSTGQSSIFGQSNPSPGVAFGSQNNAGPGFGTSSGFKFGSPAGQTSTFGASTQSGSPFGSGITSPTANSQPFGNVGQTTSSTFGTFGQQSTSSPMFGQQSTSSPIFGTGSSSTSPFGQPKSSSFGQNSSSPFGQTGQSTFGLPGQSTFGQPGQSTFGQTGQSTLGQTGQSTFSQPSQSTFGQPSPSSFGQTGQSTFGQPIQSTFGQTGQSTFGQPIQSTFGQQAAPGGFGQTKSVFGLPSFGQTNTTTVASGHSTNNSMFSGSPNIPATSPFGQQSTVSSFSQSFGHTTLSGQGSSLFGGTNNSLINRAVTSSFGNPLVTTSQSVFGVSTTNQSVFGGAKTNTVPSIFGGVASSQNPFGGTSNNITGTGTSVFGGTNVTQGKTVFGGASGIGTGKTGGSSGLSTGSGAGFHTGSSAGTSGFPSGLSSGTSGFPTGTSAGTSGFATGTSAGTSGFPTGTGTGFPSGSGTGFPTGPGNTTSFSGTSPKVTQTTFGSPTSSTSTQVGGTGPSSSMSGAPSGNLFGTIKQEVAEDKKPLGFNVTARRLSAQEEKQLIPPATVFLINNPEMKPITAVADIKKEPQSSSGLFGKTIKQEPNQCVSGFGFGKTNDEESKADLFGKQTDKTSAGTKRPLTGPPKTLFGKAIAQTGQQGQVRGQKEEPQKNRFSWKRKEAGQPESSKSVRKPSDETVDEEPRAKRASLVRMTSTEDQSRVAIICKNVPARFNNAFMLKKHFGQFGQISRIFPNPTKATATVHFRTHEAAVEAKRRGRLIEKGVRPMDIFWSSYSPAGSRVWVRKPSNEDITPTKRPAEDKKPVKKGLKWNKDDVQDELSSMLGTGDVTGEKMQRLERPGEGDSGRARVERPGEADGGRVRAGSSRHSSPVPGPSSSDSSVAVKKIDKGSISVLKTTVVHNSTDKLNMLNLRDKILRMGTKRTADLAAKAFVGTCEDMCPEKERYDREEKRRLHTYEVLRGTESNPQVDHTRAVKEYSRSSADQEEPLSNELRTLPTLTTTMNYLLTVIAELGEDGKWGDWFDFLWNRTRGIRKEITQQQLCNTESAALLEKCVRFHIFCAERLCEEDMHTFDDKINNENMTKCLQTLKEFYHDLEVKQNTFCPNEAEMRCYVVLMNLNEGDTLRQTQQLRPAVRGTPYINFALQVYSALNSNNYVRFFRLVKQGSFLCACLMHRYFTQVRLRALNIMLRSYRKGTQVPLDDLVRTLGFEDKSEAGQFCSFYGLQTDGNNVTMDKSAYDEPEEKWCPRRSPSLIESKCMIKVGEAINGKPLPPLTLPSPSSSFDQNGRFIGKLDVQVTDITDSPVKTALPQSKPADSTTVIPPARSLSPAKEQTSPQTAVRPKPLIFTNEDVKEMAKQLFWEVIDGHCDSIAMEVMRDVGKLMEISVDISNDITTEVVQEISQMAHSKLSFPVQAAVDCDLCEGHIKVDWYCLTCPANLCEKCKVVHLSRKAFRKHEVISGDEHKRHQDQEEPISNQKCPSHTRNNVTLICVTCGIPVCNECIVGAHNGHVFEILQAKLKKSKENLSTFVEKLDQRDKFILDQLKKNNDTLNSVDDETQETKRDIIKSRDAIIASVKAESEKLIEQIETRIKKNKNDISTSNSKLQSAHAKIQDTIKNARTKMEGQSFTDIDQFLNEAERSHTDTDIGVSITLSTPKFLAQANHTTPRIGTLHFEGRTVQNDPKLLTSPNIGALQLKDRAMKYVLLHPPTPSDVKVIKTYTASVTATEMRAISSTQVWCSHYGEKSLKLCDINGQQINSLSLDFKIQGFVINNIGHFIVCDLSNYSIKQVTPDGHVSTLCSTSPRKPWGICLNHKQQPVVCMRESLVVYSSDCQTKLQEFTPDQYGKPLFVRSYRVAMNGNTDYCVADSSGNKVVTIDMEGRLRWTYSGGPGQERFRPCYICCDSHMHVIVADTPNHKVHLLDKDGQVIMYITDNVSIQHPRGLAVSDDDTLWIGDGNNSQKVHVIKYLKLT